MALQLKWFTNTQVNSNLTDLPSSESRPLVHPHLLEYNKHLYQTDQAFTRLVGWADPPCLAVPFSS